MNGNRRKKTTWIKLEVFHLSEMKEKAKQTQPKTYSDLI